MPLSVVSGQSLHCLSISGISIKLGINKNLPHNIGNGPVLSLKVEESIRLEYVNLNSFAIFSLWLMFSCIDNKNIICIHFNHVNIWNTKTLRTSFFPIQPTYFIHSIQRQKSLKWYFDWHETFAQEVAVNQKLCKNIASNTSRNTRFEFLLEMSPNEYP